MTMAVVLTLVGLPGSGKSSFSKTLASENRHSPDVDIILINQDSIKTSRNGNKTPGTREDCVKRFRSIFCGTEKQERTQVVIIDRTNLTVEQRRTWIQEVQYIRSKYDGRLQVRHICLFFNLPVRLCAERAANREAHDGQVYGPKAYAIVHSCNKRLQTPEFGKEGFDRLLVLSTPQQIDQLSLHTICQHEEEVCQVLSEPSIDLTEEDTIRNTNAFEVMMSAARKKRKEPERRQQIKVNNWQDALVKYADYPESAGSSLTYCDDSVVVVRDAYPKARQHLLVVARTNIDTPLDLKADHVPLLQHMKNVASDILSNKLQNPRDMQLGFHAVPSMRRLHMHVISQDFESSCLRTKKHWISFTNGDFFLVIDFVIQELETKNCLGYEVEDKHILLKASGLVCPKCNGQEVSLPMMKKHYNKCYIKINNGKNS
jgi:aprataxin